MAAVGDTVRILDTIPAQVIEQEGEAGYDVAALVNTEAKVLHTAHEIPELAVLIGLPLDSVWVEAPTMPEGEFLLQPSEYELVTA